MTFLVCIILEGELYVRNGCVGWIEGMMVYRMFY